MALTDPSTQLYQAILGLLTTDQALAKAYGTIQDPSQPSFQLFIKNYGSGDTPALLLKPVSHTDNPFQRNSMAYEWVEEIGLAMTTDSASNVPINQARWYPTLAIAASQVVKNFGLSFVTGWTIVGGKLDLGKFQNQLSDIAAAGSDRWQAVMMFRVWCSMSWTAMQALRQQVIEAGGFS